MITTLTHSGDKVPWSAIRCCRIFRAHLSERLKDGGMKSGEMKVVDEERQQNVQLGSALFQVWRKGWLA